MYDLLSIGKWRTLRAKDHSLRGFMWAEKAARRLYQEYWELLVALHGYYTLPLIVLREFTSLRFFLHQMRKLTVSWYLCARMQEPSKSWSFGLAVLITKGLQMCAMHIIATVISALCLKVHRSFLSTLQEGIKDFLFSEGGRIVLQVLVRYYWWPSNVGKPWQCAWQHKLELFLRPLMAHGYTADMG